MCKGVLNQQCVFHTETWRGHLCLFSRLAIMQVDVWSLWHPASACTKPAAIHNVQPGQACCTAARLEPPHHACSTSASESPITPTPLYPPFQSLEGSLSGLELSQSEGMRRLSMGLNSALADAEASLQVGRVSLTSLCGLCKSCSRTCPVLTCRCFTL